MQDEDDEWRRNNDDDKVFFAVKVFYWVTDIFLNLHMLSWDTPDSRTDAFLYALPYMVISGILIILMIIFKVYRVLEKKKEKKKDKVQDVDALEFATLYNENQLSYSKKYNGKKVRITSTINDMHVNPFDSSQWTIVLESG